MSKRIFKHIIFFVIGYFLTPFSAISEEKVILGFQEYMEIVKNHHPIAAQAEIERKMGDASLLMSRGGFDPKLFTEVSQKYFKGDQYYGLLDGGVKIPTWFGIELYAAYERNVGVNLNPENLNPVNGLMYSGISLSLGQGLFIDKRRADLRQAQIFQKISAEERRIILNELLLEAAKAYWDWFAAFHINEIYREALVLAETRLNATKQSVVFGERPAIDTVEATILVQNRKISLQEAELNFINQTAMLSVFLWAEGFIPVELNPNTIPQEVSEIKSNLLQDNMMLPIIDLAIENHPELKQANLKIEEIEIEKRLKREQLKPVLNFKYNFLTEPVGGNPYDGFSLNNNTWGLEFGMPLLLRRERGDLKITELKLQDAARSLETKEAVLIYKINAALNELAITKEQILVYQNAVQNYNKLLQGELRLFEVGESSVFMVNFREIGYIDAQVKLTELVSKNRKAIQTLEYSLGNIE
jgi:outer membrane protein TolC